MADLEKALEHGNAHEPASQPMDKIKTSGMRDTEGKAVAPLISHQSIIQE